MDPPVLMCCLVGVSSAPTSHLQLWLWHFPSDREASLQHSLLNPLPKALFSPPPVSQTAIFNRGFGTEMILKSDLEIKGCGFSIK